MFGAQLGGPPIRAPIGFGRPLPPGDVAWKLTWPFIASTIIAIVMLLFFIVIFALEIASLALSTATAFGYFNTASTGAGIWCGFFIAIAGVLILLINWMRRIRLWATIALIATIIAACFAIILIGLDAKAVSDANTLGIFSFTSAYPKAPVLAAQLAFAICEFLLCLAFIGIYIAVLILAPSRLARR